MYKYQRLCSISLQGKKHIPSLSTRSYLHQNPQTYSMSPERIRLLIANFTLVDVHPTLTIFPSLQFFVISHYLPYQPISALHISTNQRRLVNVICTYKYLDMFSYLILALFLTGASRKLSNLLNSLFKSTSK